MRAMLLRQPGPIDAAPLEPVELPEPEPGPGEVRVRVAACAVCHTDLHVVEGDLPLPKVPLVPGHEVIGTVDKVGHGVPTARLGEWVGVPWLYSTCGQCPNCRSGRENLCDEARFTGFHADGGYAEAMIVPTGSAYPLPAGLVDGTADSAAHAAPLMCAGVIGLRALRLSGASGSSRLGLYGFGASAHVTIQIARHEGTDVSVFSRGEEHRRLATELGASWVGEATEEPPAKLDSAIIFAPAGWLVPEALRALGKGGTLALAGITMTPIPEMEYALLYGERVVRSVANSTREDVRELLRLAAKIPIHTETQVFSLADANEALQLAKAGRIQGAGVLVL